MKHAKKDRPKAGTFEQSRPWLAPGTGYKNYYIRFLEKCKPQSGRERRCLSVSGWVLALLLIGTGWVTGQLFRLIDWIEH